MRFIKIYLLLFSLLYTTENLQAQNSALYHDAGMWNTLNITYKINKKYTALFTQELRLNENFGRLNLLYNNIGVQYSIHKNLKTSILYRNIQKYLETDVFSFRHRLMWDITYKKNFDNLNVSYRHRLQGEIRDVYSRNKLEVGYAFHKNWDAWAGAEVRYQFTNAREVLDDADWHRVRWMGGVNYTANKAVKLGAYFVHQREFRTITPNFLYITGLECNINLNKMLDKVEKKKKRKAKTNTKKSAKN
jgi:hypothetical protein